MSESEQWKVTTLVTVTTVAGVTTLVTVRTLIFVTHQSH